MLVLVPTVKTQATSATIAEAFIKAWINKFGTTPSKKSIAVLYAHNYIETGGNTYCWNFNIGNVKAIDDHLPNTRIEYCMLNNVWELGHDGKKYIYQPPSPQTWFRSFKSLTEGIEFYINFLRNNRYKIAWGAVEAGDPVAFAKLLKQQGYYTATVESYIKAMTYQFNSFMKLSLYEKTLESLKASAPQENFQIYHPLPDPIIREVNLDSDEPLKAKSPILSFFSKVKKLFK